MSFIFPAFCGERSCPLQLGARDRTATPSYEGSAKCRYRPTPYGGAVLAAPGFGYNQWVPLSFDGKTAHFNSLSKWSINAKTGTWAVAHGNNYVLNPSFEADRISVSVPVGWKSTSGKNLEEGHSGRWSWQLSSNGTLQQQITAIPDGTYTLSVWARATGSGAQLTAKGCGAADSTTPIPASTAFANIKSAPIAITGGKCTIGVSAGGGVTLDDFVLADE
jgi:hypothetical protein